MDQKVIFTVTQLNNTIRFLLEEALPDIWVEGEISNFILHGSGHMYFSLKDQFSQVKGVMFRNANQFLKFRPENGLKVILRGKISTYAPRGDYQVIAEYMEPMGIGSLQLAFEQLKEKLEKEGLFSRERKKPIPLFPMKVGIVTSPTGAVIQDMIRVLNRRNDKVSIILYPARVQGEGAVQELVSGLRYLNGREDVETIIIGRGGGSMEDLWAFNDERLVRAVASMDKPVISAVGHETDFTLCDFAADLRAPTPSAAAELVSISHEEFMDRIDTNIKHLYNTLQYQVSQEKHRLQQLTYSRGFTLMELRIRDFEQMSDDYAVRIEKSLKELKHNVLQRFSLAAGRLDSLSPLRVLERGYSVCYDESGRIVKSSKERFPGQRLRLRLQEGELGCQITEVIQDHGKKTE